NARMRCPRDSKRRQRFVPIKPLAPSTAQDSFRADITAWLVSMCEAISNYQPVPHQEKPAGIAGGFLFLDTQ
ncbi:MAG TPA: hypothetical protein VM782_20045, partial [Stellaceae bacterium]|nr:hypothetical protein [Stellaceae bacterium]